MNNLLIIILLSLLGPIIGSIGGIIYKIKKNDVLALIAFSTGVMLAISFFELIPDSFNKAGTLPCLLGVFTGCVLMFLINKIIKRYYHTSSIFNRNINKMAAYLFIGIFLHNYPEGFAIGIGVLSNFTMSFKVALAIAFHDITETICTSAPYYFLTKSRLKAFFISASTYIPTLIGILTSVYLSQKLSISTIGFTTAMTAGLMLYVSFTELIPQSIMKVKNNTKPILSLIAGMIFVIILSQI